MADIHLHFDLVMTRRRLRWLLAGGMLFLASPDLDSESVTLTTYYPAPSGVYTNMITTGNTYLARDGGNVGIGTTGPSSKLHVNGTSNLAGATTIGGNATVNNGVLSVTPSAATVGVNLSQNNAFRVGSAYLSSGGDYMHLANNEYYNGGAWVGGAAGALLQFSGQGINFYHHDGAGTHVPVLSIHNGASCSEVAYNTTGITNCPAGQYATTIGGVMSKYMIMPIYRDVGGNTANGAMLCCTCTGGVCPNF